MRKKILCLLMSAAFIIPTYPGSRKLLEREMEYNGLKLKMLQYLSTDAPTAIINFYVDTLTQQGWTVRHKSTSEPHYMVALQNEKDNSLISIQCRNSQMNKGMVEITINLTPQFEANPLRPEDLLDAEKAGPDIASIPRYPGAVKKEHFKYETQTRLTYEVQQVCFDCVVRFYHSQMAAQGWRLVDEQKTDLTKPLLRNDTPAEIKKDLSELTGCPLVLLVFSNNVAEASIALSQKSNTVVIMVEYRPKR